MSGKKQSPMAQKCAARERTANYLAAQAMHKKIETSLCHQIRQDVRSLQIRAGIHSFTGQDAYNLLNLSGRLCFITLAAAASAGFDADHPDMRIVRGMAEAMGDLRADTLKIERHRPSIQSGLAAIDRLLVDCDDIALIFAAAHLDDLLSRPQGVGTDDIRKILEAPQ